MKEYKSEVTRQEFEDLRGNVKDLHKIFNKINDIIMFINKFTTKIKYIKKNKLCLSQFFFGLFYLILLS